MGRSGRAYFDANFEMNSQVEVLVKHLGRSADEGKTS
jgi:hypothetical protein